MKKEFNEITLLRFIATIGLVIMHSFTMYSGNWPYPEGISDVSMYYWVQKFSFSCMLELFVFISGYIFLYQIIVKHISFKNLISKKSKRLLLPCIIFSIFYIFIIERPDSITISVLYDIINGVGHLWFLPMLFICFILFFLLHKLVIKYNIKLSIVLLLLGLIAIFSTINLPWRFSEALYYLFFFSLGGFFYLYKNRILFLLSKRNNLSLLIISFFVCFIFGTIIINRVNISNDDFFLIKFFKYSLRKSLMLIYATLGIIILFYYCAKQRNNKDYHPSKTIILVGGGYSFGIYIYHQFVLELLYYNTQMPCLLGSIILPWVGFAISLTVSIILTHLSLKSIIGRKLL